MNQIMNVTKRIVKDEEGAALVEYGLLVGLIALICIAAVTDVGEKVKAIFEAIAAGLPVPGP